ncbi:hypothetical protein BDV93DRAFT_171972 [Ceratobasidium sp. AG-I]|nr:hypothetical protein BDV93DRAFT_171972 [Ceratobasidium sp. AG-I]
MPPKQDAPSPNVTHEPLESPMPNESPNLHYEFLVNQNNLPANPPEDHGAPHTPNPAPNAQVDIPSMQPQRATEIPPPAHPPGPTPPYHRIQTDSGFTYEHASAGQAFGEGKRRWEEVESYMATNYPGKPWGMWKDKQEWEIAQWMATKKVSQSDLDDLLATELVSHKHVYDVHLLKNH